MKFIKQSFITLLVGWLCFSASSASAQSGGNNNTPDSWSRHDTLNGTKFTMDGVSVGEGTLKLGLTSRYTGRFSEFSDQAFYQYLRGYLSDFKLGGGTMRVALNMRAARDTDGVVTDQAWNYHFAPTVLDSKADYKSGYWDFRLYDANVVLDNVVNYTKLTAGRFRINYLTEYKVDGAELSVGTDNYNAYAYYGLPVSYYKYLNTTVVGGGANLHFFDDMIVLRAEAANFMGGGDDILIDPLYDLIDPVNGVKTKTPGSVNTMTWKTRADLNFVIGDAANIAPYGEFGMVGDAKIFEAGLLSNITATNTILNFWVRGQIDNNTDPVSYVISDYSDSMSSDNEYTQFGANIYQGIAEIFMVGLGFETRVNNKESYYDRDYVRVMGNLDFFGVIPDNYLSFTVDYFDVQAYRQLAAERKMLLGGQMTQNFSPDLSVWLGARIVNYNYDTHPVDLARTGMGINVPGEYANRSETNSVYVAYAGFQWNINSMISLTGDCTYEMSDVIGSVDSANDAVTFAELWFNIAF
ncbi:MAG: hypothetical protein LBH05_04440 [Deferribacteraceae bacterium]|jgi:hypothetical protein|nr:hypothetical protein [Deferribacteraceae bacterium]